MSFIVNAEQLNIDRGIGYNSNAVINVAGMSTLIRSFDTVLDDFVNFTGQISRCMLLPLKVPIQGGVSKHLSTVLGEWDGNSTLRPYVKAWDFDTTGTYHYLGQKFISPHFNNFADYSGYTQISVFLPLLGFVNLDVNEIIGKWLQIRLSMDYYTGEGTYILGVTDVEIPDYSSESTRADLLKDNRYNMRIIGNYNTSIGIEIPTGSSNADDIKRNLLLGGVKMATALYTGVSLSLPTATVVGYTPPSVSTPEALYSNLPVPTNAISTPREKPRYTTSISRGNISVNKKDVGDAFINSIEAAMRIRTVGNSDRADSPLQMFPLSTTVKVIYYRPKFIPVENGYNHLYGKPMGEVKKLNEISGYTEVSRIHFEGQYFGTATSTEYALIEQAFSEGVILPNVGEITFNISSSEYQSPTGYTWEDFVNSDYNTNNFTITSNENISIVNAPSGIYLYTNEGLLVKSTDTIYPSKYVFK